MLQGYQERRESRALAASKDLWGLMAVKEKRGMLDQKVPEVSFYVFILTSKLYRKSPLRKMGGVAHGNPEPISKGSATSP